MFQNNANIGNKYFVFNWCQWGKGFDNKLCSGILRGWAQILFPSPLYSTYYHSVQFTTCCMRVVVTYRYCSDRIICVVFSMPWIPCWHVLVLMMM